MYDYMWDRDFYIWQCFENYHPSVLAAALEGDQVVGIFGIQVRRLTGGLTCGQISWINIDARKRGQGIFKKLADYALGNVMKTDALCIFSNQNGVDACRHGLGLKFIGGFERLVLDTFVKLPSPISYDEETVNLETRFLSQADKQGALRFLHPYGYRVWRFAKSPVYNYFKITVPSGDYAIVKIFQNRSENSMCGDIVDFECASDDIRSLSDIYSSAIHCLRRQGATQVTTWANPQANLRSALEKLGFYPSRHVSYFGLKVLTPAVGYLYDFKHWHMVQSDATNY